MNSLPLIVVGLVALGFSGVMFWFARDVEKDSRTHANSRVDRAVTVGYTAVAIGFSGIVGGTGLGMVLIGVWRIFDPTIGP